MMSKRMKKFVRFMFAASASIFCMTTVFAGFLGLPVLAVVSFVLCFATASMSTLVERHL